MTKIWFFTLACLLSFGATASTILAQSTAFSYQGSLKSGGIDASGNHDFEFALFDAISGGSQFGSTLTRTSVAVANGIFSVDLDFGNQFPGAGRFLEIRVRQTGGGAFTTLSPRQRLSSVPYAVKSLSAATAEAVSVGGVPSGSGNYVQNTTTQQPLSNFNISGNGTVGGTLSAGTLNATSTLNLGGLQAIRRVNSAILELGTANDTISVPGNNSLFGTASSTGYAEIGGSFNTIYGFGGAGNATRPVLIGRFARGTVAAPTTPLLNDELFVVGGSGRSGGGWSANASRISFVATENWTSTAFGSRIDFHSAVTGSTSSNRIMSITNTGVGIRTTEPTADLHIVSNGGNIVLGDAGCPSGSTAIGFNGAFNNCLNYSIRGDGTNLYFNRPTGGEMLFREENGTTQMRLRPGGVLQLVTLGAAGATTLCRNASNDISTCSSSIRYKSNIASFGSGLSLIRKFKPVSFNWKDGGMADMGLVAEDVAAIEPLLVTYNSKGEIEGVKYDRIGVVLINAVKEQQAQIEQLRAEIETLKALVCANSSAEVCKKKEK